MILYNGYLTKKIHIFIISIIFVVLLFILGGCSIKADNNINITPPFSLPDKIKLHVYGDTIEVPTDDYPFIIERINNRIPDKLTVVKGTEEILSIEELKHNSRVFELIYKGTSYFLPTEKDYDNYFTNDKGVPIYINLLPEQSCALTVPSKIIIYSKNVVKEIKNIEIEKIMGILQSRIPDTVSKAAMADPELVLAEALKINSIIELKYEHKVALNYFSDRELNCEAVESIYFPLDGPQKKAFYANGFLGGIREIEQEDLDYILNLAQT